MFLSDDGDLKCFSNLHENFFKEEMNNGKGHASVFKCHFFNGKMRSPIHNNKQFLGKVSKTWQQAQMLINMRMDKCIIVQSHNRM